MSTIQERLSAAIQPYVLRQAEEPEAPTRGGSVDTRLAAAKQPYERRLQHNAENLYQSALHDQVQGWKRTRQVRAQNAMTTAAHDQAQGWKRTEQMRDRLTPEPTPEARYERAHNAYLDAVDAMSHVGPGLSGDVVAQRYQAQQDALAELDAARRALIDAGGDPKQVTPGLGTRALRTVTGGAKGWLGSIANALGTAGEAEVAVKAYNDMMIDAIAEAAAKGREVTPEQRAVLYAQAQQTAQDTSGLYPVADVISASGQADLDLAKRGAGTVGKLAVDLGANAVQMGLDRLAGPLSMFPMVVRSFGGAAQAARAEGRSYQEQVGLGLASAVTEWGTEKLFGGNPVYDTDAGLVNKIISNAVNKISPDAAEAIMKVLSSTAAETLNEGWEEVLSGLAEPLWKMIISGEAYEVDAQELLEDWIVGVLLGVVGQGTEAGMEATAQAMAGQSFVDGDTLDSDTVQALLTDAEQDPESQTDRAETRRIYEALGLEQPEMHNDSIKEIGESNTRLTDSDLPEYLHTGTRQHVRDQKGRQLTNGESPILCTVDEIRDFIHNSITGKILNKIKGYGRVGHRLSDAVRLADPSLDITGYYLELESNQLRHLNDHIEDDPDGRNIPLTAEQVQKIPEYIDNACDVIDVIRRKDGSVRIKLGTKINGYSVIVEWVSKGRQALHPVTAWAMDTGAYETRYRNKKTTPVNTSHAPNSARQVDINQGGAAPQSSAIAAGKPTASFTPEAPLDPVGAANRSLLQKGTVVNSNESDFALLSSAFPEQEIDYYAVLGLMKDDSTSNHIYKQNRNDIIDLEDTLVNGAQLENQINTAQLENQINTAQLENQINTYPVTNGSINSIPLIQSDGWSQEKAVLLRNACQNLLRSVESKPVGTEAYALYSLSMDLLSTGIGENSAYTIRIPKLHQPFICIHNHPDGLIFSLSDILSFVNNDNMVSLVAVGNNGTIYYVEKTEDYNSPMIKADLAMISQIYPQMMSSPKQYATSIKSFLQGGGKYGIHFIEGPGRILPKIY